ncbi:MAG TPA: asparagine synthase (glutamine-hydrolyzing) [Steroidobacteraceae bacterium]|nr:asparagine synthase (glutamine-hydrolyzing) [Steroidobacteraceae bacterium]
MCGIVGFVDFDGHSRSEALSRVTRMSDAILHRGPDGGGAFVDDHVALGHRRLAIVDVSSGQQPMAVLDGAVQIVFNGEIYNYLEIRAELEAKGYQFRTNCDTEVILVGFLEWGEQIAERLNGMFAYAIWDSRTRQLALGRDRVGKKPLYVYRRGAVVAFASELKALVAGGLCPSEIDDEALDCYFTFGYIPAPRTIYRGVRKLLAAHTLLVTQAGDTERPYWRLSFGTPRDISLDEATEEFAVLFDDAVKCRLMGEVPLGAFLSGGLDSSLVVASMAKLMGRPVITNSIGFDDEKYNELGLAAQVAAQFKTEHHEFRVEPRAADVLRRIAWHFDEPVADSSALPTWYVCQMARQTVTVALSGDGGDEGFGGYTFRYVPHLMEARVRAAIPPLLRSPAFGGLGRLWPASARLPRPLRLKTIFENLAVADSEAYFRDLAWLRPAARARLYNPGFRQSLKGFTPAETVIPYYLHNDATDALGRSQYADIHFYMTDDVLVKVDRMSMAHSLEVRCPLLDYRILELAARLPTRLKIDGGRGKQVLRRLAAQRLPQALLEAPKRGFSIPAARWLREELRPLVEDVALRSDGVAASVLEMGEVRRMWREHLSGSRDHHVFLWGLLMLGLWKSAAPAS